MCTARFTPCFMLWCCSQAKTAELDALVSKSEANERETQLSAAKSTKYKEANAELRLRLEEHCKQFECALVDAEAKLQSTDANLAQQVQACRGAQQRAELLSEQLGTATRELELLRRRIKAAEEASQHSGVKIAASEEQLRLLRIRHEKQQAEAQQGVAKANEETKQSSRRALELQSELDAARREAERLERALVEHHGLLSAAQVRLLLA